MSEAGNELARENKTCPRFWGSGQNVQPSLTRYLGPVSMLRILKIPRQFKITMTRLIQLLSWKNYKIEKATLTCIYTVRIVLIQQTLSSQVLQSSCTDEKFFLGSKTALCSSLKVKIGNAYRVILALLMCSCC